MIPVIWDDPAYLDKYPYVKDIVDIGRLGSGWAYWLRNGRRKNHIPQWKDPKTLSDYARVHYVIAAWSGKRRKGNKPYDEDKTYYLRKHLEHLHDYKHGLSQITIVAPENEGEPDSFTCFLKTVPKTIQKAKVEVVRRPNYGQSYGSYSAVYGEHRTSFDYYIFIEDDYAFVKDYFAFEMIKEFELRKRCGYLCSYVSFWGNKVHAAISNGISRSDILEKIFEKYGELPHHSKSKFNYDCGPQINFSFSFLDVGTKIHDYLSVYKSPFNDAGTLKIFGDESKESLIVPLQFKLSETK
jgi:hypothetical protein